MDAAPPQDSSPGTAAPAGTQHRWKVVGFDRRGDACGAPVILSASGQARACSAAKELRAMLGMRPAARLTAVPWSPLADADVLAWNRYVGKSLQ